MIKVRRKEKKMKILKYLVLIIILSTNNSYAQQKCIDMLGSKTINKDSPEYIKCIAEKTKKAAKKGIKSLNTESKVTDWIKDKFFSK